MAELVMPFLEKRGFKISPDGRLIKIVESQKERAKTLADFADSSDYFFVDDIEYDEGARKKFLTPEVRSVFETLIEKLTALNDFTVPELKRIFDEIIEEKELKLVQVAQPVRVALTGGTASPGIFDVMEILGRGKVIERLNRAISHIMNN
ncbi:MAG: hypothetical protein ACRENZ_10865 [Thermodesulfobacteriota bacterium]